MIGYVPDTAPLADLARLIMDIHAGEQPCSGRVAAELLHRIALPRASASAATRYPRHPRSPGRAGGSRGDIAENTDWRFLNELKRELKA